MPTINKIDELEGKLGEVDNRMGNSTILLKLIGKILIEIYRKMPANRGKL